MQSLQVYAHAIRVKPELLGELVGARGSLQLVEQREEPRASGLRQYVVTSAEGQIHRLESFAQPK